jgi:RNA polymerase sigma-70 factor (ECF subfamily)
MLAVDKLGDDELVSLLNKGNQLAYTEIYNRYHAALYIHVFNKIRSREESRDIVHDLFSSLWIKREELSLQTTLAAYLYTAVRYRVFDFISHRQVSAKYMESISSFAIPGDGITDHLIRERQLQAQIDKEIATLPAKMREIFELSRKGNLSHRAIAEALGLSEQTVKKQVNNSLKIMRSKLGSTLFVAFIL